jgi:type IV pilus assembly protein PilB
MGKIGGASMSTAEVMPGIEEADSESAHADVLPFPSQQIQQESSSVETGNIYPAQVESLTTESFLSANGALPEALINELDCLGLRWDEDTLVIGAPKESWQRIRDYASSVDLKIKLKLATTNEIREAISLTASIAKSKNHLFDILISEVGEAPISNLVQQVIERAVLERASDVHFEPYKDELVVRIRVDGRLRLLVVLPARLAPAVNSRVKVLSQMNIVERRRPQDGQFSATVGDRHIDIRVSSVTTVHGEKLVLRLHDARKQSVSLETLGMSGKQLENFTNMIRSTNGLIMVAGPTGSGKTTTLHSGIKSVSVEWKNIVTIEDPVEYVVPRITQIPIIDPVNAGFAVQLRAVLRQDPDIILVGETRDAETAKISVQAALTGHLVFSSIHATDSVGAVYRLLQMDIEPHLVASSLRGVISQRLVRRNCRFCTVAYGASTDEIRTLKSYGFTSTKLARGVGCTLCGGSGYRDRIATYQVLEMTEALSDLIVSRPEPNEFREYASKSGMTGMDYEAVRLATEGITTLTEALTLMVSND